MTTPLIRRLTLRNFLSYGPEGVSVELLPLNVLIGPNASGKSNLLEALAFLRGTTGDLQAVVREGGGIDEYLWKGQDVAPIGVLEAGLAPSLQSRFEPVIWHRIGFIKAGARMELTHEIVEAVQWDVVDHEEVAFPIYKSHQAKATLRVASKGGPRLTQRIITNNIESILSRRRNPEQHPELTLLFDLYSGITLFQEWNFGRRSASRHPQPIDLPSEFLLPDASNLGLVLHDLGQTSVKRDELIAYLRRFYEDARYISTRIVGGTIQLYIEEDAGRMVPTTRLSDGTLRYLCLLAILCHPNPPPVIGIEEPELGLHPDIIPTIAELLKKASERTQLFVTTHSDALVSALSDTPESILVCESMPNGTVMERLDPQKLSSWLDEYRLGEIWRMGQLGGNRW